MTGTTQHIALLHGPLKAMGMDAVSNFLYPPRHPRNAESFSEYDATRNIRYTSLALRTLGIKVCYSGWSDDQAWLEANHELFDHLVISDQGDISTALAESEIKQGFNLPNNKLKLYFGSLQGLREIARHYGEEASVLRMRSDVFLDQTCVARELDKVTQNPGRLLIEYINTQSPVLVPDFFVAGAQGTLQALYEGMYQRGRAGESFHFSTHVDHGLSIIDMKLRGAIRDAHSMSKTTSDSVVWRGVPRYLLYTMPGYNHALGFDMALYVSPDLDFAKVIASARSS